MTSRTRSIGSVKSELIAKSREAALSAIRTYNDPQVSFKSESFIVLMVIAWTYMLHAYYRSKGIEYRYFKQGPKKRIFDRTKHGAYKYWELEQCLNTSDSPIDQDTSNNLRFLIGLRHEIEHQMTRSLDAYLSGRYQACAINYNDYLKKLFTRKFSIDDQLSYSIQFSTITEEQLTGPMPQATVPERLRAYIAEFDGELTHEQYNSPQYAFRMLFKKKLVNHPGQADRVVEFISQDTELAKQIDKEYWVQKHVEKRKYRAKDIVAQVKAAGFPQFNLHGHHTRTWQSEDAKSPSKNYGVEVQGTWYWYENWLQRVIEICEEAGTQYREPAT